MSDFYFYFELVKIMSGRYDEHSPYYSYEDEDLNFKRQPIEPLSDTREFVINNKPNKDKRPLLNSPLNYKLSDKSNNKSFGKKSPPKSRLDRRHKSVDDLDRPRIKSNDFDSVVGHNFVIVEDDKTGYSHQRGINNDQISHYTYKQQNAQSVTMSNGLPLKDFRGSFGDFVNSNVVPRHQYDEVLSDKKYFEDKANALQIDLGKANDKIKELEAFKMTALKFKKSKDDQNGKSSKAWKSIALASQANIQAIAKINQAMVKEFSVSEEMDEQLSLFVNSLYLTNDHRLPVKALLNWTDGGNTLFRKSYDRSLAYKWVDANGNSAKKLSAVPDPDYIDNKINDKNNADMSSNFNLEK